MQGNLMFFCKTNAIKWRDPIGDSRIKTLKMQSSVGGLFSVSFLPLQEYSTTLKLEISDVTSQARILCSHVNYH